MRHAVGSLSFGVILLISCSGEKSQPPHPSPADRASRTIPAPPTVPVQFRDAARETGVHFVHVNGAYGRKLLPETMGSGVAFLDYDGDGDQDLFLVNGREWEGRKPGKRATQALYRNDGTGRFTDVTR